MDKALLHQYHLLACVHTGRHNPKCAFAKYYCNSAAKNIK